MEEVFKKLAEKLCKEKACQIQSCLQGKAVGKAFGSEDRNLTALNRALLWDLVRKVANWLQDPGAGNLSPD